MIKYIIFILLLTLMFVLGASYVKADADVQLQYQYLMNNSKGLVVFNHQAHADNLNDCLICHHNGEPISCYKCHTDDTKITAKKAFHLNCKGCHKKIKQGPTKCSACHQKGK